MRRRDAARIVGPALAWLLSSTAGCRDGAGNGAGATDDGSSGTSADGFEDSAGQGAGVCQPAEIRACYGGPPGTEGLGACQAGQQSCTEDGAGWTECSGEVTPEPLERCDTPQDDDCDGSALCEPTLDWWQSFPAAPAGMAFAPDGSLVIVGLTGSFEFQDVELHDMFVLSLDVEGNLQWSRSITGTSNESINGMVVDEEGRITIVGAYEGDAVFGGAPLPPAFFERAFAVRYDSQGKHIWSRSMDCDAFSAVATGHEGVTYVGGRDIEFDDRGFLREVFVIAAFDDLGALSWERRGAGIFGLFDGTIAVAYTKAGEVVAMATMGRAGEPVPDLDGEPLEVDLFGPHLLHLDRDGELLSQQPLFAEGVQGIDDLDAFARPDGTLTVVANAVGSWPDGPGQAVLITRLDASLEPRTEKLVGDPAWAYDMAPAPGNATLLGLDFGNVLELGPIGVGVPQYGQAIALTSIDHEGSARWLELLHTNGFVQLHRLAAHTDGAVMVAVSLDDVAVIGGETVFGSILAKLRP